MVLLSGVIGEGAEARVYGTTFIGRPVVVKYRVPKDYREEELDTRLRYERTKQETRIMMRARMLGVRVPHVYDVGLDYIIMERFEGRVLYYLKEWEVGWLTRIGEMLSRLHAGNVVHGDFTPANLVLLEEGEIGVIDFGLSFLSDKIEDLGVDLLTLKKSLIALNKPVEPMITGYLSYEDNKKREQVVRRMLEIEKRARYVER